MCPTSHSWSRNTYKSYLKAEFWIIKLNNDNHLHSSVWRTGTVGKKKPIGASKVLVHNVLMSPWWQRLKKNSNSKDRFWCWRSEYRKKRTELKWRSIDWITQFKGPLPQNYKTEKNLINLILLFNPAEYASMQRNNSHKIWRNTNDLL